MDSGVIIALILGLASIITSLFYGLVPTIRKNRMEKLERKVTFLLRDLDYYYEIESLLLEEYSKKIGINKESLKREVRSRVKEKKRYTLSDYSSPSKLKKELARYGF